MTLTVIFVGLIAFVPSHSTGSYWALVVKAVGAAPPDCIIYEGDPKPMDHTAYLVIPETSLEMGESCPCTESFPASVQLLGNPVPACRYELEGYDISLGVTSTDKLNVATGAPRDLKGDLAFPVPRNPAETVDLAWTRSVEEGTGTREKVRGSCLAPNPVDQTKPPVCDLAGRLHIEKGRIENECIVPYGPCKGGYARYGWVIGNQPPTGDGWSFGEGVKLTIDDLSGPRTISLRKFAEESPWCTLPLKEEGDLQAFVTNQEGTSADVPSCPYGSQRPHPEMYRFFYKLTEPQKIPRDCVYPKHVCAPMGYPRCPGAVLSE